ncbi:DNA-binding CsgD family transcriptional regulator [Bradyrhizobium sp. i1.8.4]|uniref:helix-turn-helix transcriptional regulator n=1 Tax=unclassified Bradyrhizobium TaxID=2631580 RepID=UPI003D1C2C89
MDHVVTDDARENGRLRRTVSAARGGIIFVDTHGQVVGMDSTARHRLDGEVKQLKLPLRNEDARDAGGLVDCFVSAETVSIRGVPTQVCVIQEHESTEHESMERESTEREVMTAIESVLADTSSFARSIIDRIKTLSFASSRAAAEDLDSLTEREKEVLGLICQGKSDLEMSIELNVSHNTVRNHISSLYRKIGVNRRSTAILWVRERGIAAESLRSRRRRHRSDRQPL